jgi:ABC-type arginine transport system ATPase subunit
MEKKEAREEREKRLNRERVARYKDRHPEKLVEAQQRRNDRVREALALWNAKKREEAEEAGEVKEKGVGEVIYVKEDSADGRTPQEKKEHEEQVARYARGRGVRRAVEQKAKVEEEVDTGAIEEVRRWAAERSKEKVVSAGGGRPGVEIELEGI